MNFKQLIKTFCGWIMTPGETNAEWHIRMLRKQYGIGDDGRVVDRLCGDGAGSNRAEELAERIEMKINDDVRFIGTREDLEDVDLNDEVIDQILRDPVGIVKDTNPTGCYGDSMAVLFQYGVSWWVRRHHCELAQDGKNQLKLIV